MARPLALKTLQQTPTDPSEAGPDNRLCQKCGLWGDTGGDASAEGETTAPGTQQISPAVAPSPPSSFIGRCLNKLATKLADEMDEVYAKPSIVFLGNFEEKDRNYLLAITRKMGVSDESIVFRSLTICPSEGPTPLQLRCCRAFLLGWLGCVRPSVLVACGDHGLAALTGNASMRVTHQFGREITIPEIPEQVAFATYHPEETRNWRKAMRSIQNNFQIVRDVKRTQEEVLKKPVSWKNFDDLNTAGACGFDSEFDDEKVWTVSLAVVEPDAYVVKDIEETTDLLIEDNTTVLTAHYAQVDLDTLVRLGCAAEDWLQGKRLYDTFVLCHIQNENLPLKYHYGIEDCLTRLYRAPNWKAETAVEDPAAPGTWGLERRKKRCGYDAWASLKIFESPEIQAVIRNAPFVVEWQHRMIPTYHRMKYAGVSIDQVVFDRLNAETSFIEKQYREKLEPVIRERYQWEGFHLSNNADIRTLLYEKMGMPKWKYSESGLPSVDADAMEDMVGEPMIPDLLHWRKAHKLVTTWYGKDAKANSTPLFQRISWGDSGIGYLPVNLGVGQTVTLRRQSNAPNMQNWAKETRPIVCSRWGNEGRLIWADYEKLEVYLLADEIHDNKLKSYFLEKGGYLGLAKSLMGIDITKESDNYRAVKATALGANYNMKAMTLATQLYYQAGVRYSDDFPAYKWNTDHYRQCKDLLERYHRMFPKIGEWQLRVKAELIKKQGVHNRLKQFRHLPCPNGEATPGFPRLLNQAINFKIQSVAGFVTGIAAVLIEESVVAQTNYMQYHKYLYHRHKALVKGSQNPWIKAPYLCNEVHDELMVDLPIENVAHMKEVMRERMTEGVKQVMRQGDPTFDAYLGVEIKSGRNWCVPDCS